MPPACKHSDQAKARTHMPVAAARQTSIVARYAKPLVADRVGKHQLYLPSRLFLSSPERADLTARAFKPHCQCIPSGLQLS